MYLRDCKLSDLNDERWFLVVDSAQSSILCTLSITVNNNKVSILKQFIDCVFFRIFIGSALIRGGAPRFLNIKEYIVPPNGYTYPPKGMHLCLTLNIFRCGCALELIFLLK